MTKVHPNAIAAVNAAVVKTLSSDGSPVVLTVWKKSLLFNCNGFTVFDGKGNLLFRVDNYVAGNRSEIVLMDATGKSLFTVRRKRLSLGDNWLVFNGDTAVNPRCSAKKPLNPLNSRCLALVSSCGSRNNESRGSSGSGPSSTKKNGLLYEIEGSYTQRCCVVYDEKRRRVAEVKRKEAVGGMSFGVDVFRLVVQPEMEVAEAMVLVVLLDQMYGSSKRFSP